MIIIIIFFLNNLLTDNIYLNRIKKKIDINIVKCVYLVCEREILILIQYNKRPHQNSIFDFFPLYFGFISCDVILYTISSNISHYNIS